MDLKEIGLTGNEEKVYLALIDLGPALAGKISRKTGLHRRTVYDTTDKLIEKGFVSYIIENNRKLFNAINPERIIDMLEEKKMNLRPIVNELGKKYGKNKEKEETCFYKGKAGLKNVFESQLEHKEIWILGATPKAYEIIPYYFKWYDERRVKKKIKLRILTNNLKKRPKKLVNIRYLPKKYNSPVVINIYGNNVAIILWSVNPFVIVIKNKEIADGYRNYFELIWNTAREKN
ncbi:MAG: helix-turn-helix domain-containing protein [Candidatus Pacearchaeota archaeon]|nr:helix-turn-helix domain-containing protein [Candidatus Pacearchaeota archaeon]